jgi:3-hydroxyacyl-[acyl-carrier-protein] dehydratase
MIQECCEAWLCVPNDHPALPGHFPGAPVVPAVVLLDQLLSAAQLKLGRALRIAGLTHAKFLSPLFPDQPARCRVEIEGARLAFHVEHAGQVIARGVLLLAGDSITRQPAHMKRAEDTSE